MPDIAEGKEVKQGVPSLPNGMSDNVTCSPSVSLSRET